MPRHQNHAPFPSLPAIESATPLTDAQIAQVRTATALAGLHNVHNRGNTLNKMNKWDRPAQILVTAYVVSDQPIEGVPAEDSLEPTSGLHVAMRDEEGDLTGHAQVVSEAMMEAAKFRAGVLLKDSKGRGWFHEVSTDTLRPVTLNTPPIMKDLVLGGQELADLTPTFGEFCIEYQKIRAMHGDLIPVDYPETLDARVAAEVAREDAIAAIVDARLTEAAFARLMDTQPFPTAQGIFPPYERHDLRKRFDEALEQMAWDVLTGLRDAGFCAPCPNNGPRGDRSMKIWDAFVEGRLDADEQDLQGDDGLWKAWISLAPAFKVFQNELIRVSLDAENARFAELHSGKDRYASGADRERIPFTREEAMAIFPAFRERMIATLSFDEADMTFDAELRDGLTGDKLVLVGSLLRPVLAHWRARTTPLTVLDAPKKVRHYTLTLPSHRLAMADHFRIPGFRKALKNLSGEDQDGTFYDINNAQGLDQRAHDYLTKAGIAIVQVSNTSPAAYLDGPGIWRMGHMWEDGDDEDLSYQKPLWRTCTDLWANTFASPEAIVNVLMHSGEYETEAQAEAALIAYCEETYGAHIVDLGVETLHVYAPTGAEERKSETYMTGVGEGVLTESDDWQHKYILADRELPVDPEVLSPETWVALPLPEREPGFTL